MSIIGALPYVLTNGNVADASQVQADLQYIVNQVNVNAPAIVFSLPGYISGLILSTAGSSVNFGISAGVAADPTYATLMTLSSAYVKTTSAWAVGSGNGALDTGSIAVSTWYHVFLIARTDTGVVDVLISLSATSPTLPTSYTLARRIGSMKTNGSSQWTAFLQRGNEFYWATPIRDVNTTPTSGATNTVQLTTPTGIQLQAVVSANTTYVSGGTTQLFIWDPALTSAAFAGTVSTLAGLTTEVVYVFTDVNAYIKTQLNYGGAVVYFLDTLGWIDARGANG